MLVFCIISFIISLTQKKVSLNIPGAPHTEHTSLNRLFLQNRHTDLGRAKGRMNYYHSSKIEMVKRRV